MNFPHSRMSKEIKERCYMVSGYFGNLEPNLQWYFSDVLPGGTFRVRHGPGRGHRPLRAGVREGEWTLSRVYLISRSCLRCSLCTIIHSHYILTSHHHPTYYKSSQKTEKNPRRGKLQKTIRTWWWHGEPGEEENDIHWTGDNIFLNFWNYIHRASGIIDKHDKTALSLNKLFWDKKLLGNIVQAPWALLVHSLFIFVRNCKSGTVRGEHMYSRQKVHSLKSQGCLQTSIYYLFLLQFPALWSPGMTGRFCLDYGG